MSTEAQEKPKREIVIGVNGKPRPMTSRERIFAMAYGDPSSPTFANGTQSYLRATPDVLPDTAKTEACKWLTRPNVANTIADIMNKAGLGIEVRADSIRRIISHKDIGKVVSKTIHTEDGEAVTTTEHGPGYKDMLKAIDVANKMDGLYAKNQGAVDVAVEEYRSLSRRFFQPRRAKPPADTPIISPVASKEGPASDDVQPTARKQGQRKPKPPRQAAAPGAGGGGQPESRGDCVSLSPTADENSIKGGM